MDDIIRLIVIEESANDAELILNSLRKARFPIRPRHIEDAEELQEALNDQIWDLLIAVPLVGELTVEQACEQINSSKQDIPVIVLGNKMDGKTVAGILSAGAAQVIPGGNGTCLQKAVSRELDNLGERRKRKYIEQLYRESQRHNKMLLETSRDAIAYVHDGMHIHANPAYLEIFGYKNLEDLEGLPVMDLVSIDDQSKFKEFMREYMTVEEKLEQSEGQIALRGVRADHKMFKLNMEVSRAIYDSERCVQIVIRDQSQNQELERKLKEASQRDQLTGLYNRQHFIKLLDSNMAKALETTSRSVLMYIGLDSFISGKISAGNPDSDAIIKHVGKLLKTLTSEHGTLGRFTDNAFTLLLPNQDVTSAVKIAEKICKTVEAEVTEISSEKSIITTASIGITLILASASNPQDVLHDALSACKTAFKAGGNRYEIYKAIVKAEDGGDVRISDVARLIETAIDENRLSLRYQPIVSLHGETKIVYEVFLRMVDSEGSVVSAGKLFGAAEQANLTTQLDKWVLQESVKMLMKQSQNGQTATFFIKLSDQAVKDEKILLFIRQLLKVTQLPGERMVFEISESLAISQVKLAKAFINSLKMLGCKSALEHFGTGLNSSTTLKHIPVDFVKIDSSFVHGLASSPENLTAIQDIIKLTKSMGKQTIAEAVEDANSLQLLWQCEVDFVQGHYISEPLDDVSYDFSDEE